MPLQPLSLKQRLANLHQVASGPSSLNSPMVPRPSPRTPNFGAIGSAITKRKAQFRPPWANRDSKSNESHLESANGSPDFDEVFSRMIFQAGVDYETRPLVVMNASAFPDPHRVSYDLLLSRMLSYLDLFVESDYSIVFFAAGGHHTPSWNWVWKAYRSLNRKYRKNLKRLYIVHSSFFSKMLFSLAGAIISPKFFRKITYIGSLSELACHVPLTQIDIPPAVYSENLKYESQITLPTPTHSRMFGVTLEDLMGAEGEKDGLPRVVRDCIQYLRETGLEEEGLFRRSPNSAQLRQVREAYDRGQTVALHSFGDPHLAAVLLKKFLRDLPEPVFPEHLYDVIRRCPNPRDEDEITAILYIRSTLLPELPPCKLILLSNILLLLHEVSLRSHINRMDAHNLAIVLTPNLVASGNPVKDVAICAVDGGPAPLPPSTRPTPANPMRHHALTLAMNVSSAKRAREQEDDVEDSYKSGSSSPTTTKALRLTRAAPAPLFCSLPPTCNPPHNEKTALANVAELEAHYAKYHAHVCEEKGCSAVFPNARLLELHQTECHNPIALLRKERGEKIFACHLETCARKFLDPKKRRLHLIQAHGYPKEYFFSVTNKGVGGLLKRWGEGASMIRGSWKPRDGQAESNGRDNMEVENEEEGDADEDSSEEDVLSSGTVKTGEARMNGRGYEATGSNAQSGFRAADTGVDALADSISSLSLVPPNIRFGRGGKRTQTARATRVSKEEKQKQNSGHSSEITHRDGPTSLGPTEKDAECDVSINIDAALEALKSEAPPNLSVKADSRASKAGIIQTTASGRRARGGRGRGRGSTRGRGSSGGHGRGQV